MPAIARAGLASRLFSLDSRQKNAGSRAGPLPRTRRKRAVQACAGYAQKASAAHAPQLLQHWCESVTVMHGAK